MSGKGAARVMDRCSGHGCWPSRPAIQGSHNVFFNNKAAHRQGDLWQVHCCKSCHTGNLASGSSTVFTNNKQQGRVRDPVNCGSFVISGSSDIFIGD